MKQEPRKTKESRENREWDGGSSKCWHLVAACLFLCYSKCLHCRTEDATGADRGAKGRGATAAGLRLIAFNLKMKSLELELGTFNSSQ